MKGLKELYQARKTKKENSDLLNALSYFTSLREWGTVRKILSNAGNYTSDTYLSRQLSNLFLLDSRAKYFGIGEDIVGSMSNMVFGGNVSIKVENENEEAQKIIDKLLRDGYFMQSINNAYKAAISTNGRSYLFMELTSYFNGTTNAKVKDEFVKYTVVPEFELKINELKNIVTRSVYKEIYNEKEKEYELFRFDYEYRVIDEGSTLTVVGYDKDDKELTNEEVMNYLGIDITYVEYDFIPFGVINVGEGMLPNIIFIEDSLAKALYYQDEDLSNSQTSDYVPEDMVQEAYVGQESFNIFDKYETRRLVKGGIDKDSNKIVSVEGKSAISTIERNLALNVIKATLDAKINPISIGYVLTDRLGGNTDVGSDKERASIRLRETHIDKLKPFVAKEIKKFLHLEGIDVDIEDIAMFFAQYITPNIESLTNTLAKQIQFGLISIESAVRKINANELTDEEVELEVEKILQQMVQMDLNVSQQIKSGIDNRLNGEQIEE